MPKSERREYTDLLIRIHPWNDATQCYPVEAWVNGSVHFSGGELRLDNAILQAAEDDPTAYGLALFYGLFSGTIPGATPSFASNSCGSGSSSAR